MSRKILALAVTMFLLMASLAYAANMQVNSSAVPVSGGTITPNGIKFFGPLSTDAQRTYTVAAKTGWNLINVQIDGVTATAPYVVPFDTSRIHTIKANFGQTLTTFSLTATAGAGGTAIITGGGATGIKSTDSRKVVVGPNTGYSIASVTLDGTPIPAAAGSLVAYTVDLTPFGAQNHTVAATFSVVPKATVSAGLNKTVSGTSTTLAGTVTSSPAYSGLLWTVTSGPAGASFTDATILNPTLNVTASGIYTVTLRATVSGANFTSSASTITFQSPGVAASNSCITCHNGSAPVVAYSASGHAKSVNGPSCDSCHAGSHPGVTVTSASCESCHSAALSTTTHPAELTSSKCLACHNAHDPAAGIANLGPAPAHPAVTLYTFEEVGMQMANGAKVPVQVDANGKGMPYSPKQTCGTSGCHVKNGIDYTYDKISDHAFHSNEGRSEYQDSSDGKFSATKNKPWTQSTAMVGKW